MKAKKPSEESRKEYERQISEAARNREKAIDDSKKRVTTPPNKFGGF